MPEDFRRNGNQDAFQMCENQYESNVTWYTKLFGYFSIFCGVRVRIKHLIAIKCGDKHDGVIKILIPCCPYCKYIFDIIMSLG